jgi:hypothetical protein
VHPKDSINAVPVDRETAIRLSSPPKDIDRAIWLYELCRFLCENVNTIIIALFADNPPCSAMTCNEMRASEWQYLCAVHDPPKACCAIDYCCHTLDWAANVLTSPKHFPSRLTLGHGHEHGASHAQMRQLTNIFRRVYRIFAHAWFQHREMFWKVESETGLYIFFKTVCDVYGLIPEDNYTVPPEAEGKEPTAKSSEERPSVAQQLKEEPKIQQGDVVAAATEQQLQKAAAGNLHISTGHTTKRHRQTPSVDAGSISTVLEENEDDDSKSRSESSAEDAPSEVTAVEIEEREIELTEDSTPVVSVGGNQLPEKHSEPAIESSETNVSSVEEPKVSEKAAGPVTEVPDEAVESAAKAEPEVSSAEDKTHNPDPAPPEAASTEEPAPTSTEAKAESIEVPQQEELPPISVGSPAGEEEKDKGLEANSEPKGEEEPVEEQHTVEKKS